MRIVMPLHQASDPATLLAAAVLQDAVARRDWGWFGSEAGRAWTDLAGLEPGWVDARVARLAAERSSRRRRVDLGAALPRPVAPRLEVA